ncbi:MAG TPA: Asp-tRNA(Asn)/Glu-tRNA(Gln) amidotransferase subunit GatC [Halanaerobiales bacterium]|nr:Asp-tRNA(Asn)/Glu-tRNA(Gln) amidotransferase subunit GatC [Halanaerobiales bacterium]
MIDKDEVRYIADLASLKLSEEEVEKFSKQLSDILDYVEKLDELDTEDIVPTAYTIPVKNVMREDKVEESLELDKVLQNAPEQKDNQFRVPKIMDEDN